MRYRDYPKVRLQAGRRLLGERARGERQAGRQAAVAVAAEASRMGGGGRATRAVGGRWIVSHKAGEAFFQGLASPASTWQRHAMEVREH